MNAPPLSFGLLATARYSPRLRLERSEVFAQHRWMAPGLKSLAKGRRAMANWDEDAVTMAVAAARSLLRRRAAERPGRTEPGVDHAALRRTAERRHRRRRAGPGAANRCCATSPRAHAPH